MKSKTFRKKLVLNKKTISNLDDAMMKRIAGGYQPPTTSAYYGLCCQYPLTIPRTLCHTDCCM